mgnify:CR=1 FL=1
MAKGKKTGGRLAGSPNKITANVKEAVSNLVLSEMEKLTSIFKDLEPDPRAQLTSKLLQFIIPKPECNR